MRSKFIFLTALIMSSLCFGVEGANSKVFQSGVDMDRMRYYAALSEEFATIPKKLPFVEDCNVEIAVSDETNQPTHVVISIQINQALIKSKYLEMHGKEITQDEVDLYLQFFEERMKSLAATVFELQEEDVEVNFTLT